MRMSKKNLATQSVSGLLTQVISQVPEPRLSGSPSDEDYIRKLIKHSALKSSSVSAALAVPGGVVGLVSALPDIAMVWRIQSQLISNIAAAHGKSAQVTREQMLWCMFRQMAVGVMKEVIVQQGSQYLVRTMSDKALKSILGKVGHGIVRSQGSRAMGKVVPLLGSVSAGALTYYDTWRVGRNAHRLYSGELILLPESASD